jgi:ABC-type anion transport system duplicated permease subunit
VLIVNTPLKEALQVCGLACITMVRVFILIALASVVWVPIGIWVGMRPRAAEIVQPIAQFMAAFPATISCSRSPCTVSLPGSSIRTYF